MAAAGWALQPPPPPAFIPLPWPLETVGQEDPRPGTPQGDQHPGPWSQAWVGCRVTGGMGASLLPRREFQPETLLKVEGSREETAGSAASGEGYSVHGNLSDLSPAARDGEMLS